TARPKPTKREDSSARRRAATAQWPRQTHRAPLLRQVRNRPAAEPTWRRHGAHRFDRAIRLIGQHLPPFRSCARFRFLGIQMIESHATKAVPRPKTNALRHAHDIRLAFFFDIVVFGILSLS